MFMDLLDFHGFTVRLFFFYFLYIDLDFWDRLGLSGWRLVDSWIFDLILIGLLILLWLGLLTVLLLLFFLKCLQIDRVHQKHTVLHFLYNNN